MEIFNVGDGLSYVPGFLYCLSITIVSLVTWAFYRSLSPIILSVAYGILIVNIVGASENLVPGINFCANHLMEWTVAMMGLVNSAITINLFAGGILNAILIVFSTLFLSLRLSKKLGLSEKLTALIGIGISVCGASSIATSATRIDADEQEINTAIECVEIFSLSSLFIYLFLFIVPCVRQYLKWNMNGYALWVGSGVSETSHAIAAAGAIGFEIIGSALLVKLLRMFMIGPALLFLCHHWNEKGDPKAPTTFVMPVYVLVFIGNTIICGFLDANLVHLGLLGFFWSKIKSALAKIVLPIFLTMSLAGVGSKMNIRRILRIRVKPMVLAAILSFFIGFLALILTAMTSFLIYNNTI